MSHPNAELAAALHRAADLLIARDITETVGADALAHVTRANAALSSCAEVSHDERLATFVAQMIPHAGAESVRQGDNFAGFAASPYSGSANALRPTHVTYTAIDNGVRATLVMGDALEGRPGRAHGGATAAVFDDVMGAVQRVVGRNGYTRTLTVNYYGPVPTVEPVEFVATLTGVADGRFTVDATATYENSTVATASGVFTEVSFETFGSTDTT